ALWCARGARPSQAHGVRRTSLIGARRHRRAPAAGDRHDAAGARGGRHAAPRRHLRRDATLRRIDLGFDPEQVVTLDVEPQTRNLAEYRLAYASILQRVAALPGIETVGAVYQSPLTAGRFGLDSGYLLEGQRIDVPESWKNNVNVNFEAVAPGF